MPRRCWKTGWQAGREFELAESDIRRRLVAAAEPGVVTHVEQTLNRILSSIKWIEEKGRAFTEETGGKVPEVVILLSPAERSARAARKAQGDQQQYATGTPGHERGTGPIAPGLD
jgi:hypothetical protein